MMLLGGREYRSPSVTDDGPKWCKGVKIKCVCMRERERESERE